MVGKSVITVLEASILEAYRTLAVLPMRLWPDKYEQFWPPYKLEYPIKKRIKEPPGDIDHMDRVLFLWLGNDSPLDAMQKRIIVARCGRGYRVLPWRKVSRHVKRSREYCRLEYYSSLLTLDKWLKLKHL